MSIAFDKRDYMVFDVHENDVDVERNEDIIVSINDIDVSDRAALGLEVMREYCAENSLPLLEYCEIRDVANLISGR